MKKYNVLTEVKSLIGSDLLLQVEEVANSYKPEDIFVTDATWQTARPETKGLLIEVDDLQPQLLAAYRGCVAVEDWEFALYLYMQFRNTPDYLLLDPILDPLEVIKARETEFIIGAHKWLDETMKLLGECAV